jgi:hypothetical protein
MLTPYFLEKKNLPYALRPRKWVIPVSHSLSPSHPRVRKFWVAYSYSLWNSNTNCGSLVLYVIMFSAMYKLLGNQTSPPSPVVVASVTQVTFDSSRIPQVLNCTVFIVSHVLCGANRLFYTNIRNIFSNLFFFCPFSQETRINMYLSGAHVLSIYVIF